MTSLLLQFKSLLLIVCIFAESVMPLLMAEELPAKIDIAMELETENETGSKEKEEKADNDKIPFKFLFLHQKEYSFRDRGHFNDHLLSSPQTFKGVLTPPPRKEAERLPITF